MQFNQDALEKARGQGYSDEEIFSYMEQQDQRFGVAKQQGYSLDEIASQLTQGGEKNEAVQNQQEADTNRNEQREPVPEVQLQTAASGKRYQQGLPPQDQGQRRGDDQTDLGKLIGGELVEEQNEDAQGGIQGTQEGQGVQGQIPAGNQAEVIPAQEPPKVPPQGQAESLFSKIRDFGVGTLSSMSESIYGSIAGLARGSQPEYLDIPYFLGGENYQVAASMVGAPQLLPSLGIKIPNPRYEEAKAVVDWAERQKAAATDVESLGAKPLEGAAKTAAQVTGGLLKLPSQILTGPLGFSELLTEGYGAARENFFQKEKQKGLSDEEATSNASAKATATTAAMLPLYMLGGKVAGAAADALIAETTPKAAQAATLVGLNTIANASASAVVRGVEAALSGENITEAMKNYDVPQFIMDFAFASHASVVKFKEMAAEGKGKEAVKDLSDPVLEAVSKDPQYAPIADEEIARRVDSRASQEAAQAGLPKTAQVIKTVGLPREEAPGTEVPTEVTVTEEPPTEIPAEAPAMETPAPAVEAKTPSSKTGSFISKSLTSQGVEKDVADHFAALVEEKYAGQKPEDIRAAAMREFEESGGKLPSSAEREIEDASYWALSYPEESAASHAAFAEQAKLNNEARIKAINDANKKILELGETKPAEAPAEAQPTKPSEAEIQETSRVSPVEGVAPVSEAAVKSEEGIAPRQGEGEAEQVAPLSAEAAKPEVSAPPTEPTFLERAESWADSVIKESSKRVSTGLDPEVLAAYAVKGAAVIARGAREFGAWAKEMKARFGDAIEPHLSDIWSKSNTFLAGGEKAMDEIRPYMREGGGPSVMRGTSERMAEEAPESLRYQIQADELVARKKVSFLEANEFVSSLSDNEVLAEYDRIKAMPKSESQGAYKVALGRKASEILQERGDDASAARIINEIAEESSYAGVFLSAVGNFFATTPKGYLNDVIAAAEKKGVQLSEKAKQKVSDLYKSYLDANKNLERATNAMFEVASEKEFKDSLKELKKLGDKAIEEQERVKKYVGSLMPMDVKTEMYPALQKLGLITPRSAVINLSQNIIKGLTVDLPSNLLRASADKFRAAITGKERQFVYGPKEAAILISTTAKYMPEMATNIIKSIAGKDLKIKNPTSSLEVTAAFDPKAALKRLTGKNSDFEYDYTFKQKAKDFIETTYGRWANLMGNLLVATDRPSRIAAEKATASSIARTLGLKGLDYNKFMEAPEKGIEFFVRREFKDPRVRAEKISQYKKQLDEMTKEALMEKEGKAFKTVTSIQNIAKSILGDKGAPSWVAAIFSNAVLPFVRFSSNFAAAVFRLARPEVATLSLLWNLKNKNSLKASRDFGYLGVSLTTAVIASQLYKNGIITPSYKAQSKEQEAGKETGDTGGLINLSALSRFAQGKDQKWKDGDRVVKLGSLGLVGIMMNAEADVQQKMMEQKIEDPNYNTIDLALTRFQTMPGVMKLALNASAVKGVSDFLSAATRDQYDQWYKSVFKTVIAIPVPTFFEQISKAVRENTIDTEGKNVPSTLYNIARSRFGYDKGMPKQYGMWGEPIPQTPKGENPVVYNLINPFNSRTLNYSKPTEEMMLIYKKTLDKRVIPSEPDKQITVGKTTYRLDTESHQRLKQLVGESRLKLIKQTFNGQYFDSTTGKDINWSLLPTETKLRIWSKRLDLGEEIGRREFIQERQSKGMEIGKKMLTTQERMQNIKSLEK